MADYRQPLLWLLCGIIGLRLLTMAVVPMTDPTEPRYAETARLMATSGDWITPWFTPGVPFWGKPPLAFWAQAASMKLFGVSDLAARVPTWLAMIAVLILSMRFAFEVGGSALATWSGLIFASMAQVFIAGGAVFTDPFLVLGTTLSIISLVLALKGRGRHWKWLFFVGLAIGLLAKGPLVLVLVGLPVAVWVTSCGLGLEFARSMPWLRGILLTAILVVPWYAAAELKTPGFLDYFLVGEHFNRFVDPAWSGNLYGRAHDEPRGAIWLHLVAAAFPWSLVAFGLLLHRVARGFNRSVTWQPVADHDTRLLLLAGLAPAILFTVSGNILWTYVLPGLPFLAILLARVLLPAMEARRWSRSAVAVSMLAPVLITVAGLQLSTRPQMLKSAAPLFQFLASYPNATTDEIYYLDKTPHSARYYSRGKVRTVGLQGLATLLQQSDGPVFLAVSNLQLPAIERDVGLPATMCMKGARHTLIRLGGLGELAATAAPCVD